MLTIKDPEADRLARQLAEVTGETIMRAVTIAVRERLGRVASSGTGLPLQDNSGPGHLHRGGDPVR